jgi:hypothetical protein
VNFSQIIKGKSSETQKSKNYKSKLVALYNRYEETSQIPGEDFIGV